MNDIKEDLNILCAIFKNTLMEGDATIVHAFIREGTGIIDILCDDYQDMEWWLISYERTPSNYRVTDETGIWEKEVENARREIPHGVVDMVGDVLEDSLIQNKATITTDHGRYAGNNVNIHYAFGGRDFILHSVVTALPHHPFNQT